MTSDVVTVNVEPTLYSYEYFQQEDVCRLCWSRNAFNIIINNTENPLNSIKEDLIDKITDCLNIVLSPYSHPNRACDECCIQLNKFHDFKKFCQQNDKKLEEILQNGSKIVDNIKIEEEINGIEENCMEDVLNTIQSDDNLEIEQKPKCRSKWRYQPKRTPTYCNVCMIECKTIEHFKTHNFQCHGIENGQYKCFGCEKLFKTRKSRFCHENNFCKGLKDGFKCTLCNRFLPKRGIFESHMRDHRENVPIQLPDEMFKCQKCEKLFGTRENLKQHVESEHGADKKNYVCEVSCDKHGVIKICTHIIFMQHSIFQHIFIYNFSYFMLHALSCTWQHRQGELQES